MGGKSSPERPERRSNEGDGNIRDTFRWKETCWLGRHNTLQSRNGRVCPMALLLGKVLYKHSVLIFDGADKFLGVLYIILFIRLELNILYGRSFRSSRAISCFKSEFCVDKSSVLESSVLGYVCFHSSVGWLMNRENCGRSNMCWRQKCIFKKMRGVSI